MSNYDLLALDLDGTLLQPDGMISAANRRAVRRAQEAGVQVVLCTGRNVRDARIFSSRLDRPADWLVTSNGADVRALDSETPLCRDGLSPALALALVTACAACGGEPSFYTPDAVYYGAQFEAFIGEIRARGGGRLDYEELAYYHRVPDAAGWRALCARGLPIDKAILYHQTPAVVDEMTAALADDGRFELAPSSMFGGALKNVEVNRAGVHKGTALARLAGACGVSMDRVLAMGDSDNDLGMLRAAGRGIAMENAEDHIKAAAGCVAPDYCADGVAWAIGQYILEERI